MSTIEERTAAREAMLLNTISTQRRLASPKDYLYDKAQDAYWDTKDNSLHQKEAVDASIPIELWRVEITEPAAPTDGPKKPGRPPVQKTKLINPSRDIMRVENDQFVEGSTWWPGMPQVIHDYYFGIDGAYKAAGRRAFNQFRPPLQYLSGNAEDASIWVDHIKRLWPDPAEHDFFFNYMAHMLQRPEEKCNAAIVLSGEQGIGKDSALHPFKQVIGDWNVKNISPDDLFSDFKPWLQTLMLVIDEVRPSKDEFHASSIYNILKPLTVSPPSALALNEKYVKMRYIRNVVRIFITTNNWMDMFIPPSDRRMMIMHSKVAQNWHVKAGDPDYFTNLYAWMEGRGIADIAAWLRARDLRGFKPQGSVPQTMAWRAITNSWAEPDDGVSFSIEALGRPPVFFATEMLNPQFDMHEDVRSTMKSPRKLTHRMQRAGYEIVENIFDKRVWSYTENGKTFRSRFAFVLQGLEWTLTDIQKELETRGRDLARRGKTQLRVVTGGGE